jgi:hypothetical protein
MEGIGAAEIVLVHRRELRDALITEQSNERRRVQLSGSGIWARGTALLRRMADRVQSRLGAHAGADAVSLTHQSQPASVQRRW